MGDRVLYVVLVERLRPELGELDLEQRWRARCDTCGWTGSERYFRERALMDCRHHDCDKARGNG